MAEQHNKNYIFYKDLVPIRNWKYRLQMIPGDITTLSTPTEIELPDNLIIRSCKVKHNYDNDMPTGQPLADEMNLEIKINCDNNTGVSQLVDWIIAGQSSDTKQVSTYVYKDDFYSINVPNRWRLLSNNGSGSSYTKVEFEGFQEIKPKKKFTITKQLIKLDLKIIGAWRSLLERSKVEILNSAPITPDYEVQHIVDYLYVYDLIPQAFYGFFKLNQHAYINKISSMATRIENLIEEIACVMYRSTITVNIPATIWFSHWTFYALDTTTLNQSYENIPLTTGNLGLIESVIDGQSTVVGGLLDDNSENQTLIEYDCFWDLFSIQYEGEFSKVNWIYEDNELTYNVNKVLDSVSQATKTTLIGNDISEPSIEQGGNFFNHFIIHYKGTQSRDLTELDYKEPMSTLNDDSFEPELMMNNIPLEYDDSDPDTYGSESPPIYARDGYYLKNAPGIRCLYAIFSAPMPVGFTTEWVQTAIKVHEKCVLSIGDSKTITTDLNTDNLPLATDLGTFATNVKNFINKRQVTGIPKVIVNSANLLFNNYNQGLLSGKTRVEDALPRFLGDMFAIDVTTLTPDDSTLGFKQPADYDNGKNAILSFTEADFISGTSDVKYFMRAD